MMKDVKEKDHIRRQNDEPHASKLTKRPWWAWCTILLLPIIFFLPLWSEALQVALIGYEGFCCMPNNWQELERKAERARNMRLDSNLIIGMGIVLAIVLLVGVIFVLYKYAIPSITIKWIQHMSQLIVGILVAPLTIILSLTLILFIFRNDHYHTTRYQSPEESIYAYAISLIAP